jgi:hypothetical protein
VALLSFDALTTPERLACWSAESATVFPTRFTDLLA